MTLKGLSNYLNMREPYLHSDFLQSTSLPIIYDTDLENFWTQKSIIITYNKHFMFWMKRSFLKLYQKENFDNINQNSNMSIQQKIDINTNIEYQKYQVAFN